MSKPGFCRRIELPSYDVSEKECDFSFLVILFTFLCLFNPNICIITELRKMKLKVEILHEFKEFLKEFFNLNSFFK